jgi:hypothetical protein
VTPPSRTRHDPVPGRGVLAIGRMPCIAGSSWVQLVELRGASFG